MKITLHILAAAMMFTTYSSTDKTDPIKKSDVDDLNKSGYAFTVNVSRINSKHSEIASTVFRDKLVFVSSKKIGAIGNGLDPNTNEPFTDLYCSDIKKQGDFDQPLLFSRILNTKGNEGQIAFSPDEHTVYYTRSERNNSANYQLFKAELKKDSYGKWINETEFSISSKDHSIENPHISADGKYLYFASNMKDGFGGFDIYKAEILSDGSLGEATNLGNSVNTAEDEKYPHTTKDGKELYFSSKGHNSVGGYDIFISNSYNKTYTKPRNLGYSVNSIKDEIGFLFLNDNEGVFSSNKNHTSDGYNMYRFESEAIYQELRGIVISEDNRILPNTTVVLLNSVGQEIGRQTVTEDASYSFQINPFEDYKLVVVKEGFKNYKIDLHSEDNKLRAILKLAPNVRITYN